MKKICVLLIVSLLIIFNIGCNKDSVEYISKETYMNETIDDTPSGSVFEDIDAYFFATAEELETAVKSKQYHMHSLSDLEGYYLPKTIPQNAKLDYIQIKDFYVAAYYKFNNADAYYMVEWFRTLSEGQLQDGILKYFSSDCVSAAGKYYIVTSENTSEVKDVFWEENGKVFHAVVPSEYSPSEIGTYCTVVYKAIVD